MEPQTINLPEPLASALLSYMRDRQDSQLKSEVRS